MMQRFYTFFVIMIALSGWLNVANAAPGPKIEGPWLWMVVPTVQGGDAAAASGKDYLAAASGGTVTEQQIATNGATAGDAVGDRVWTSGSLAPTGNNNINDLVNAIGFGEGDININNHVAYGSIVLNAPREQNTKMYVGSDDAAKVWLNGTFVHTEGVGVSRGTEGYWDAFPVTLKKGKNILFVAVYYRSGAWSGFFGFEDDAVYTVSDAPSEPDVSVPVLKPKASVPGPKIEGPWLWMIAPMGNTDYTDDYTETDWLAKTSDGTVTEQQIATQGATGGAAVGDRVWTPGKLAPTGNNNINDLMNTIGFGEGDINNHVAYGSIALNASRQQNTKMYIGSSGPIKVWLNGTLVHVRRLFGPAEDYKNVFPVTLKKDKNALFVVVYNIRGNLRSGWSGFFGFEGDAVYTVQLQPVVRISASERPPLYWIDKEAGTLHRLISDEVENLIPSVKNATSLAVDVAGGKLYWAEKTSDRTGRIRRANLDGTNVQLVKNLTSVPHGLALDTVGGKIYLTNAWGKVQHLNVNGSNFQPNLITGLDSPKGLTLDVSGGKVYWTEISGRIRRANLDGSNIQNVVARGSGTPMNLVVFDGSLYWTQKTGNNRGEIRFLVLDSNSGDTIPNTFDTIPNTFTEGFPVGIGLDTVENKLYWTTSNGKIGRSNLDGGDFQPVVTGLGTPGALALSVEPTLVVETKEIPTTDAVLSITPSPVLSPAVGEQLMLSLKITAGEAVAGYQFTVQFDPTALHYVESSNGDYLPTGAFFVQPVVNRDRVELAASALAGVSKGDGTLATLTFEVMAVKASTLTLSDMLLSDDQGNTFLPQVEGGEVTEPPKLKGDVNSDSVVNILDLVYVASNFGETGQNPADVNDDGIVNISDLVLVAGALNTNAGAPSLDPSSLELLTTTDVRAWLSQAHQLNSVSPNYQRGVSVLEQLLAALTPKETTLLPNYPNPFNPETWIPYQLAKAGDVKISIYDTKGTVVRHLELGHQSAGYYASKSRAAYWNGRNTLGERVASGIYFYHLQTDNVSPMRKMIILK